ncbi:uncharacterized protein LOC127260255 [Andrographis paniculata]|uniref:uncharacterized protein LOC127260255 n=1 Tax=Andrographis paniculata TaxID=175694 RepID=UPI0021E706CD|nr:uncharacterized protein LOC127260255 [Andrographis paniculata]
MAPHRDIGWDHATPISNDRKQAKCNYCGKIVHGGITRMKQHIAHVTGQVEACTRAPKEIRELLKKHLIQGKSMRAAHKKKLEALQNFIRLEDDSDEEEDEVFEINEDEIDALERKHLKRAMAESRNMEFMEQQRRHSVSGDLPSLNFKAGGSSSNTKGSKRNFFESSMKKTEGLHQKKLDPYMFQSKNKSLKNMFSKDNAKKVGRAISKFFHFNAIPFHAADSGPYYQTMIDTIASVGPGVKGPTGKQIGGEYLNEEMQEVVQYVDSLKQKWKTYGCTIMCDGWSTRTKHPIINFMVYCDRDMIYHSSVDCTNKAKTADFVYTLMDKVVESVGVDNIVQIVTDSEASMKAAGKKLMRKRKHIFWSPCAAHCIDLMLEDIGDILSVKDTIKEARRITGFIYNSDKVVNLMKTYTNGRDLLRPGITRFATEFVAMESLLRYATDLKRMCTSREWVEYNNTSRRRHEAGDISDLILNERFWKRIRRVCGVMEPLVKVLKVVDQDKKPTLPIIYEAMDRAKMAIKTAVKDFQQYWDIIDERWYNQLHQDLHAAAYFLNPGLQYSGTCEFDSSEVRKGVKEVIKRLEPDLDIQVKDMNEINIFVNKIGEFGSALAIRVVSTSLPDEWVRENESPLIRDSDLNWLDEAIEESGDRGQSYSYGDSSHSSSNRLGRQEWDQPNAYHNPYYSGYGLSNLPRHLQDSANLPIFGSNQPVGTYYGGITSGSGSIDDRRQNYGSSSRSNDNREYRGFDVYGRGSFRENQYGSNISPYPSNMNPEQGYS